MANRGGRMLSDANIEWIKADVSKKAFALLEKEYNDFPPPPKYSYNPNRFEKDVHPDMLSDSWLRR